MEVLEYDGSVVTLELDNIQLIRQFQLCLVLDSCLAQEVLWDDALMQFTGSIL